jgi:hypothetical protein
MKRSAPLKRKTPMKRGPWRRHMSKRDAELRNKLLDGSWEVDSPKGSLASFDARLAKLHREGFIQPSKVWLPYELQPKQPSVRLRRTWLKRESERRKIDRQIYMVRSKLFLQEPEHKWCELMVTCGGRMMPRKIEGVEQESYRRRSTQVHHVRGRGKWYLDERWWKGSCLHCHAWENTHRNEAVKLGLRERIYDKH